MATKILMPMARPGKDTLSSKRRRKNKVQISKDLALEVVEEAFLLVIPIFADLRRMTSRGKRTWN
ncbi:hypothetical protein NNRS527_01274 [Nitrosospira sp. NRS527]|nr:hypothetical protein NNRS527_01274 [Nitrosospira sp. NRS527]